MDGQQAVLTPTQRRLLVVLSDGLAHRQSELLAQLSDGQGENATLAMHFSNLRKLLKPQGDGILCVRENGEAWYSLVSLRRSNRE